MGGKQVHRDPIHWFTPQRFTMPRAGLKPKLGTGNVIHIPDVSGRSPAPGVMMAAFTTACVSREQEAGAGVEGS